MIYSYNKDQQDALFFKFSFGIHLFSMTNTVGPTRY